MSSSSPTAVIRRTCRSRTSPAGKRGSCTSTTTRRSSPNAAPDGTRIELTVERLDDGEVSPYLTDELRPGDRIELRGPIGGYFIWEPSQDGPVLLAAGGSGVVPLMAMARARAVAGSHADMRLVLSSRSCEEIIYRAELERLS